MPIRSRHGTEYGMAFGNTIGRLTYCHDKTEYLYCTRIRPSEGAGKPTVRVSDTVESLAVVCYAALTAYTARVKATFAFRKHTRVERYLYLTRSTAERKGGRAYGHTYTELNQRA